MQSFIKTGFRFSKNEQMVPGAVAGVEELYRKVGRLGVAGNARKSFTQQKCAGRSKNATTRFAVNAVWIVLRRAQTGKMNAGIQNYRPISIRQIGAAVNPRPLNTIT